MKKSTWIVVGAFILFLIAFLLFQKSPSEPVDVPEPTPQPTLRSINDQELISFTYQEMDGETIHLEKTDTLDWTVTTHPEAQVTAGNVEAVISNLSNLRILTTLSEIPPLDEIGLEIPQMTITFDFEDGTTFKIDIGDLTPLNNGYYTRIDNGDLIVLPMGSIDQVALIFNTIITPSTPTPAFDENSTPLPSSENND